MALRLYHDSNADNEITSSDPDTVEEAVAVGNDLSNETQIYLASDDSNLTYENISITAVETDTGTDVTVEYAEDQSGSPGTYQTTYNPPDGDYSTAVPIWRRVTKTDVQNAFQRDDIVHEVTADEYVA